MLTKLTKWIRQGRRERELRKPRDLDATSHTVEQFERRLCLGAMAASTIADWSAPPSWAAPAVESVMHVEPAVDAGHGRESKLLPASPALVVPEEATGRMSSPFITSGGESRDDSGGLTSSELDSPLTPAGSEPGGQGQKTAAPVFTDTEASSSPKHSLQAHRGLQASSSAPSAGEHSLSSNGSANLGAPSAPTPNVLPPSTTHSVPYTTQALSLADAQLMADDVELLLQRASAATASQDAIIAVVDRFGRILGVRVEDGVFAAPPSNDTLVFAIDGAVAKARTAALFSNNQAPITSRTVRFISQSTITQREVESNPNVDGASQATALASTERGPGFVAPIGVGGHFPPEIMNTPLVDLFGIEHTNRDSNIHPGVDGVRGTGDDVALRMSGGGTGRFNIDPAFVPAGQELFAPESYGHVQNSGLLPDAQSRGIATLPGGIPLFCDTNEDGFGDTLVGGIGVFFPGEDGFATHEQGFVPGIGQTESQRTNASKVLEAEFIALAAAGGSLGASSMVQGAKVGEIAGLPAVDCLDLPFGRIDLVGITLESIGPIAGKLGIQAVIDQGMAVGPGAVNGVDQPLAGGPYRTGMIVPEGWLVLPHNATDGSGLTGAQVQSIIETGIAAAEQTRAAIRLPLGSRTSMVFAVTDTNGEVLGLFRMPDATTFSLDVAVAKARNVAYYADPVDLQAIDQANGNNTGVAPRGTAFTNRTFRFLAQPRYPSGIDGTQPPDFSILNDDAINDLTAENEGAPAPVGAFDSVYGYDAFFPMTNFHDPGDAGVVPSPVANQNGVVFFPGSTPLYVNGQLVGGFGVSGDGVDQDDTVTFLGARDFLPRGGPVLRADQIFLDDVRLPYQKFLRNPFG
jgi:uncharacterized protein GlcG (DUF336 family)